MEPPPTPGDLDWHMCLHENTVMMRSLIAIAALVASKSDSPLNKRTLAGDLSI